MKKFDKLKTKILLACLLGTASAHAAILTEVPMQGGMVMPMLKYQADPGHIQVMMTSVVPALTPLLVSNPSDQFDPADPWFSTLDPGAHGASFSRRYGFMWDSAMSDPLPSNTQVWIRKLSSSPGLEAYRYSGSVPKTFAPVFGTAGTSNALAWNLMMFHPCFTAAPGTNALAATFEVFLVDSLTGQEIAGSSTGPFLFDFTNLHDGRPALTVAPKIAVGWPAGTATNWVLESATSPDATTWDTVTNTPVALDGEPAAVLDAAAGQQYFRMRYVP